MSFENYDMFVASRFKPSNDKIHNILHAAVGIAGESGEVLDSIKKTWIYGKSLDLENIIEELGDLEFYMQALRSSLGLRRDDIIEANIQKLQKRYPSGYTNEDAIARRDKE